MDAPEVCLDRIPAPAPRRRSLQRGIAAFHSRVRKL